MTNTVVSINQDQQILKGDFVNAFLNTYTEKSRRIYKQAILEFFNVTSTGQIKLFHIQNIYATQVQSYIDHLVNKGNSQKTISRKISTLKELIDYVNFLGMSCGIEVPNLFTNRNFKKSVKNKVPKTTTNIEIFTKDEIQQLYKTALSCHSRRDYILLKFLFNTGARREEIVTLTPNDVRQINNEWAVTLHGKGRKSRTIFIRDELKKLLDEIQFHDMPYFQMTGDNVYKIIQKYCKRAGISKTKLSPHVARHTFMSIAKQNGASLSHIKDTAGHSSEKTTEGYVHDIEQFANSATRYVNV